MVGDVVEHPFDKDSAERRREHKKTAFQQQIDPAALIIIDRLAIGAEELVRMPIGLLRNFLAVRNDVPKFVEIV